MLEDELAEAAAALRSAFLALDDDLRARDVGGHEVGRELDASEGEVERACEGADEECLAHAWHAFEQDVPADEEAREDPLDDLSLPHYHLADLIAGGFEVLTELPGRALHVYGVAHRAKVTRGDEGRSEIDDSKPQEPFGLLSVWLRLRPERQARGSGTSRWRPAITVIMWRAIIPAASMNAASAWGEQ